MISTGTTLSVIDSTLFGNTAVFSGGNSGHGGAIWAQAGSTLSVINSTLFGNTAQNGGGGIFNDGVCTVQNTIIAGSIDSLDVDGNVNSQGNNLIGNSSGSSGWVDSDLLNVDPMLGPLADNGGPTETMALLPGSPAINAGNSALAVDAHGQPLQFDQRGPGFPRIVGSRVDMGAFEVQVVIPSLTGSSAATAGGTEGAANSSVLSGATFTDANPGDLSGDMTATIDWGDNGPTSAGVVSYSAGVYTVAAAHTYAEEGAYPINISVADQGGNTTTISGTATVADAPLSASGAAAAIGYSTYLGGSMSDEAIATAVDSSGNSYIAGYTTFNKFSHYAGGTWQFVPRWWERRFCSKAESQRVARLVYLPGRIGR